MSLRALVVHNYYRSANASGENLSVDDEVRGLREIGWDVEVVSADSDVIGRGEVPLADLALRPIYSRSSVRRVTDAIARFRPHVALVENVFPLHSPWVVRTLRGAGVPVAAGVRSYRMWCAASTQFRDGAVCRDCAGSRLNLPAIRHGCYQGSAASTVPLAASLALHRRTFRSIDTLLAVTEHVGDELVRAGFDRRRIVVRPNFVHDPGPPVESSGHGFLFAGRLTADKGVELLLDGWARSEVWRDAHAGPLVIAGSGPLADRVERVPPEQRVAARGLVPHAELLGLVADAAVTVVPSIWPEPFGRGVIEAAARGRPSLVTDAGGLSSLVVDGETGWVAGPDAESIAAALRRAADPDARRRAGAAARRRFTERYTREVSIGILDTVLRELAARGIDLARR